jgi:EmrB/QacA subfamily drug resistance transporter
MAAPALPSRLRLLIPLVVAFGFLMEQLDATIITTAIPDIAQSLNATPLSLNLAITSYVLSLAVFIPVSGWISDRYGTRNVICAAFALFTIGSATCGLATSLPMLVAARILQGLGGAMMNPVGRLILLRAFPREQLVRAMAYVSIPSLLGPTLGPLLGGVITTYASWRWIFYVNIPFGLMAIAIAWHSVENPRGIARAGFDLPGFLICGAGMVLLQFMLETVGRGAVPFWADLAALAGGAALMAVFVRHAHRTANPVLDLSLFHIRSFRVGSLAGGISRIAINAPPFLLPLLFQLGFGYSAMQSGSLTFVVSLGAVAIRLVNVWLLRTLGFPRLLIANSFVATVSIAGFALFRADTPHWLLIAYIMFYGVVRSIQFNAVQMLSYADMPPGRLSASTSLGGVVQQLTMGLGVSLSAALLGILAGEGATPTATDFRHVFLVIALLPLAALPGFFSLQPQDGSAVSGHRPRGATRPAVGD